MSVRDYYIMFALMPAAPNAQAVRDALSNFQLDSDSGEQRPNEFLDGFVPQPGGKFVATYVTDNLADIQAADDEPSMQVLFVKDMNTGLHLGQSYVINKVDPDDRTTWIREVDDNYTYTPHPTYELFVAGNPSKAKAFDVNKMLGTP